MGLAGFESVDMGDGCSFVAGGVLSSYFPIEDIFIVSAAAVRHGNYFTFLLICASFDQLGWDFLLFFFIWSLKTALIRMYCRFRLQIQ